MLTEKLYQFPLLLQCLPYAQVFEFLVPVVSAFEGFRRYSFIRGRCLQGQNLRIYCLAVLLFFFLLSTCDKKRCFLGLLLLPPQHARMSSYPSISTIKEHFSAEDFNPATLLLRKGITSKDLTCLCDLAEITHL